MKKITLLMICLFLLPGVLYAAEFYRWTDENGVVHVTDQPPATTGKEVRTYRYKNPVDADDSASQKDGNVPDETITSQAPGDSEEERQTEVKQEVVCDQALIDQARADYEEAKSHEIEYRRNFNDSYGYGKERKFWRGKLQEIEDKKQRLDSLEDACDKAGQETAVPENP